MPPSRLSKSTSIEWHRTLTIEIPASLDTRPSALAPLLVKPCPTAYTGDLAPRYVNERLARYRSKAHDTERKDRSRNHRRGQHRRPSHPWLPARSTALAGDRDRGCRS